MTRHISTVWRTGLAAAGFALASFSVQADGLVTTLAAEQQKWDRIQYTLPAEQHEEAFKALAVSASGIVEKNPDRAEAQTWYGITLASQARANGGLGALTVAREARKAFDNAVAIDGSVMHGAAYYGLGGLYAKVPRWPIGFGDKAQAEAMFKRAVATAPNGLDSNYYYGDFLVRQDRPNEARPYLERALKAPLREGRELADGGRRAKVEVLIRNLPAG